MMFYDLTTPPENGGVGLPYSEAINLTIPAAVMLLTSREKMERRCKVENRQAAFGDKSAEKASEDHRDYMKRLRLRMTGNEDL